MPAGSNDEPAFFHGLSLVNKVFLHSEVSFCIGIAKMNTADSMNAHADVFPTNARANFRIAKCVVLSHLMMQ